MTLKQILGIAPAAAAPMPAVPARPEHSFDTADEFVKISKAERAEILNLLGSIKTHCAPELIHAWRAIEQDPSGRVHREYLRLVVDWLGRLPQSPTRVPFYESLKMAYGPF